MSYLAINGVTVAAPQEFSVGLQDIDSDSSGRNANGKMVRDVIAKKVKLECKWGPLSNSESSSLLSRVQANFFTVTYPDPQVGGMATKTFYVGDRTLPSYSWNAKLKAVEWQSLSMNFIEQ